MITKGFKKSQEPKIFCPTSSLKGFPPGFECPESGCPLWSKRKGRCSIAVLAGKLESQEINPLRDF